MSSKFGAEVDILSHSPPSALFQSYSTVFLGKQRWCHCKYCSSASGRKPFWRSCLYGGVSHMLTTCRNITVQASATLRVHWSSLWAFCFQLTSLNHVSGNFFIQWLISGWLVWRNSIKNDSADSEDRLVEWLSSDLKKIFEEVSNANALEWCLHIWQDEWLFCTRFAFCSYSEYSHAKPFKSVINTYPLMYKSGFMKLNW